MARNKHPGKCYQCGREVAPGTGHFERHAGGWRVKHANVSGDGRVTCDEAAKKEWSKTVIRPEGRITHAID